MYKEITIDKFRGINKARINNLHQVNLFFGKNNCCKSTVLEAVFLLTGQSNPYLLLRENQIREYQNTTQDAIATFFHKLDIGTPIVINGFSDDAPSRKLEIESFRTVNNGIEINIGNSSIFPEDRYGYKYHFYLNGDGVDYSAELLINPALNSQGRINFTTDGRYNETIFGKILPPKFSFEDAMKFLGKIISDKQKNIIISSLQTIEPKIIDINLVGNDVLVDMGLSKMIPINMLGDGIRKMLSIIVSIFECKNGVLMVDEIDNGFHFSAMRNLWRIVLETAKQLNTQLFITTHNIDSLQGLNKTLNEEDMKDMQKNVAAHKLLLDDTGELKSLCYDYKQFDFCINQEIEMR